MKFLDNVCRICVWLVVYFVETSCGGPFDLYGLRGHQLNLPKESVQDDVLFLTPYIEKGEIKKAQQMATVLPLIKGVQSFSGFLTVNKTTASNLFFWFFKSQSNWQEQPIVIWLQGGPGASSMFGLFTENGPFSVNKKFKLRKRKYSWNKKYNLLYIDNPVGAGFSFTKSKDGYARTQEDVAKNLYAFLIQFLELFPNLQKNRIFITGESYAGKYIPAIAYKIYKANPLAALQINLAGICIGNGFTDPANQMQYAKYLYQLGLIDKKSEKSLKDKEEDIRISIRSKKYMNAFYGFESVATDIIEKTGLRELYDFVHDDIGEDGPEIQFINDPKTRKALHVGNLTFDSINIDAYEYLESDFMQSVKPWVEELLTCEKFPIMFYSGQLDIIVAYPLSVSFFNTLEWPHADEYAHAKRCQFKVGAEVAGYFKRAGTFTEVLVRNTGHMVPTTQPKWAFELISRFITNSSSFTCA